MNNSDFNQALQLISNDFELDVNKIIDSKTLVEQLSKIIHYLLNKDLERLLQICYRVDLGEKELQRLLYQTDPESMAEEIALALIKRQLQKIELRRKYRSE